MAISYLLNRHYSVESAVTIKFTYSDEEEPKYVTLRLGDEVTAKYLDASGNLQKVTGIITDIINKRTLSGSFKANEQMGNGNYELQFKIDASLTNQANVVSIYLIDLYDIRLGSIPEYTVSSSAINGEVDKQSVSELQNTRIEVNSTPKTNYTKFSSIILTSNGESTEHLYINDTFTPELPFGMSVTYIDNVAKLVIDEIDANYSVVFKFDATPKYTITSNAIKGTVSNPSITVIEHGEAIISCTPDELTELKSITIDDGIKSKVYYYNDTALVFSPLLEEDYFKPAVGATTNLKIKDVYNDFTITFEYRDKNLDPGRKFYKITSSAVNGTVDEPYVVLEEGSSTSFTATSKDTTSILRILTIKKSTDLAEDYVYDYESKSFDRELPLGITAEITDGEFDNIVVSSTNVNNSYAFTAIFDKPLDAGLKLVDEIDTGYYLHTDSIQKSIDNIVPEEQLDGTNYSIEVLDN